MALVELVGRRHVFDALSARQGCDLWRRQVRRLQHFLDYVHVGWEQARRLVKSVELVDPKNVHSVPDDA